MTFACLQIVLEWHVWNANTYPSCIPPLCWRLQLSQFCLLSFVRSSWKVGVGSLNLDSSTYNSHSLFSMKKIGPWVTTLSSRWQNQKSKQCQIFQRFSNHSENVPPALIQFSSRLKVTQTHHICHPYKIDISTQKQLIPLKITMNHLLVHVN